MREKKVPSAVYDAAREVYLGGREDAQPELYQWASRRWPLNHPPEDPRALAFWIVSAGFGDGVAREARN